MHKFKSGALKNYPAITAAVLNSGQINFMVHTYSDLNKAGFKSHPAELKGVLEIGEYRILFAIFSYLNICKNFQNVLI